MIHSLHWIFGSGASINCNLKWIVPETWKVMLREEKIKRIKNAIKKEWRIFHNVGGTLYGYPAEALNGIYFGAEMPNIHLEIIALVIQGQNPNVKFYRAKKSQSKFAVSFEEFTYTSFLEAKKMGLRA